MAKGDKLAGLMAAAALGLPGMDGGVAAGHYPITPLTQNPPEERWTFPNRLPTPTANPLTTESFPSQITPAPVSPLTLAQSPSSNARLAEADRLFQEGIELFSRSQFLGAIASWQQALELYRALENRQQQGTILGNLGTAHANLGDYQRATEFLEQSLAILREQLGDRHPDVAKVLNNLAELYGVQGRYREAESLYQQALTIYREQLGERHPLVAVSLDGLAVLYRAQGRYGEAEPLFQQALAIRREQLGEIHPDIFTSLSNLGSLYRVQGRYEEAESIYREALTIVRAIGDLGSVANTLNDLGNVHFASREYLQAIRYYEQELALYRQIGHRAGENSALSSLGWTYAFQGQYELALSYFNDSFNISQQIGDNNTLANALYALGWTYHSLGDFQSTLELYENALKIFEETRDINGLLNVLNGLGWVQLDLNRVELAIVFFRRQLEISRSSNNRRQEANALNGLGFVYAKLGEYRNALDYSEQALIIHREINDLREEAYALSDIGNIYAALGEHQTALDYLTKSLLIQRTLNNRWGEGRTLGLIAQVFEAQQQPELAIVFLKSSVVVRESIREDIRNLDIGLQQSFTNTIADDYRRLANLLLSQGRIPEAQQVLDLLKVEELREFTNTRATWTGTALAYTDPEQAVVDAHGSLIALGSRLLACEANNCPDLSSLYDQQEALRAQYDRQVAAFNRIISANRGADDVFQNPERLSGEAERLLAAYTEAGETAVLIYPFVLEDKLWLVWATAGNVIGSVEVPVSQGELAATVQRLGELLNRGALAELQTTSQQLYNWIIQPLAAELEQNNVDHLIFVNDRVTRYIPMAALFDGDRFLLERYRISTVLSPALTQTSGRLGPVDQSQVLGLGLTQPVAGFNPLPAVAEELTAIVRDETQGAQGIFPGRVFLDHAFTFAALRDNVASHRVLHIATHAAFIPGRAQESYIVLGNGDRLSIPEINTLERRLRNLHLVVLSACQTALGGPGGDGTEIAGISSYFLQAGRAETVIASLWSVNDASTSVLMQRFYALLATGELSKAEALRQAQLSLLRGEDLAALGDRLNLSRGDIEVVSAAGRSGGTVPIGYRHPYHWAPFILIGNGL